MKTISAKRLTPEALEAFGKAIKVFDGTAPDVDNELETYCGQLGIMDCHGVAQVGIYSGKQRGFKAGKLEQHRESPELLAALSGDFVTLVTSSVEVNGRTVPDESKMAAIRVDQGEAVLFDDGTWHWSPYPVGEKCDVLVVFKKDTPRDDYITAELEEPVTIVP